MKLIRDRTPGLLPNSTRPVHDLEEFQILLQSKLMEEAAETAAATSTEEFVEEAADIIEVITALCSVYSVTMLEILTARDKKYLEKGAFEKGIVLLHDPLTNKGGISLDILN
jgi:predicted house-cleaning noncanonical NTP pyrophosphatase (MazG superfamily)